MNDLTQRKLAMIYFSSSKQADIEWSRIVHSSFWLQLMSGFLNFCHLLNRHLFYIIVAEDALPCKRHLNFVKSFVDLRKVLRTCVWMRKTDIGQQPFRTMENSARTHLSKHPSIKTDSLRNCLNKHKQNVNEKVANIFLHRVSVILDRYSAWDTLYYKSLSHTHLKILYRAPLLFCFCFCWW